LGNCFTPFLPYREDERWGCLSKPALSCGLWRVVWV
jgi:hypothetical protein